MRLRGLSQLARGIAQLIFPNACLICDTPEGDRPEFRHGLCSACELAVTKDPLPSCPHCAATVGPHADTTEGCLACRAASFGFDAAIRLGPYEGKLRDALLRMKSANGDGLAELMGRVFWERCCSRLCAFGAACVIPIPLHWRRRFARGHNQAAGVARELAAALGTPFATSLRRVRHTPQQAQPTAAARRENVKGAFRVAHGASFTGQVVLLVDDVMTTGSTASEAARTLKSAGAKRVIVAVLARR